MSRKCEEFALYAIFLITRTSALYFHNQKHVQHLGENAETDFVCLQNSSCVEISTTTTTTPFSLFTHKNRLISLRMNRFNIETCV